MRICLNCKKIFEDDVDICPDCAEKLQSIVVSKKEKNKTVKILGIVVLSCLGLFGILLILYIILFSVLFKYTVIPDSDYKYNDLNGIEAKEIIKEKVRSVDELVTESLEKMLLDDQPVRNYSTSSEVAEKIFLMHPTHTFNIYENGFTNPKICDETAYIDEEGSIYCITNWSNENRSCDFMNKMECSIGFRTPNLYVDINGALEPNKLTKKNKDVNDIFAFGIYNSKVDAKGPARYIY